MSPKTHPESSPSKADITNSSVISQQQQQQQQETYYGSYVGIPDEQYASYQKVDHHDGVAGATSSSSFPHHSGPNPPVTVTPTAAAVITPQYVHIDSRKPVTLTYCPTCATEGVTTTTQTKANGTTAVCVAVAFIVFWPLFWLPFCIDEMKQTNHYCAKCGVKVGRVKPFH
jgi:LITAF-like zinc ribbon domain